MSLFTCESCGCVENTALCNYWMARLNNKPTRCSECESGTWHGLFPKRLAEDTNNSEIETDGTNQEC